MVYLQCVKHTKEITYMKTYTVSSGIRHEISLMGSFSGARQISENDFAKNPELYVQLVRTGAGRHDNASTSALLTTMLSYLRGCLIKRYPGQYGMSQYIRKEAVDDILSNICIAVLSTDKRHEFWGAQFWVAFDRQVQGYNHVRNHRQNKCTMTDITSLDDEDEVFTDNATAPEVHAEINDALSTLLPRERAVFLASHYMGMTQNEIAAKLKVTSRTVYTILTRAEGRIAEWRAGCKSTKPTSHSRVTSHKGSRYIATEESVLELNQALDRVLK